MKSEKLTLDVLLRSRVAESQEHGERRSKEGQRIPRKDCSKTIFKIE